MASTVKDSFMDLERHRQLLEDNIEALRKTVRHWQTWEAEYEGLKEEILSAASDITRGGLIFVMRQYKGDLVNGKEIEEIISSTTSKSTQQVLNLLDRRMDYVQQNVKLAEKQLELAEHKLAVATVISTPEVRNEEGLPMTEIIEELDDEGNIISSRTSIPGSSKQQLLEVLQKAGVETLPTPSNITQSKVAPDDNEEPARSPPTAARPIGKAVQFADGTKPGPEVQKSHTAKRIEDIMSIAKSQSAILSHPPVIPGNESAEEAALRREMLQYGMSEVGAVVAELNLEDGSDWSDEDFDPEDTSSIDDEDSFGRSMGKVVDDGLRQRMIELEQRLGIRMMENIGKKPDDSNTMEEGIGRITISADEKKVETKGIIAATQSTDDKTSNMMLTSNLQASNATTPAKKSVRFSESLDVSPTPPEITSQRSHVPTTQRSVAPVGDIVERKAPEQSISNPTVGKSPSQFKATRAPMSKVLNGPLSALNISQLGTSLSLHPAKGTSPKPFSTSIQFSPMVNPSLEVPTGPEGKTLSSSVVERDISFTASATEPDELDPHLLHQEVATEYHKMRNRMIQRQGGFLKEEESEIVLLTEEEGGPKKLSRFKAARLARA